MAEKKRAFGYMCPACGKLVFGERTEFAMQAAAVAVICDCGKSELTMESDGQKFRVTVPCGVCDGEHRAEVDTAAIMEGNGVGLACPENRQLCCYIGDTYRVESALADLQLAVEKKKEGQDETFIDSVIMYEVLSELRDIASRDGISCTCGSKAYSMEIHGAAVDLVCTECGGRMRLPAATDEDLDQLCCRYTLTIKGRG